MAKRAKAKYKLNEILSSGFELPDDREELMRIYRTAAKVADQRLVRLEQASVQDNYQVATKWAYAKAERFIQEWSGPEATRFSTKAPESDTQLKQKIEDIRSFLEAPTSTKTGIRQVHQARANTLNERYGTNFKWNDVATFFDSDLRSKMERKMGSETMVKVVAYMQKNKRQVVKAVESANVKDMKVPDNMVGKLVQMTLRDYGADVVDTLTAGSRE